MHLQNSRAGTGPRAGGKAGLALVALTFLLAPLHASSYEDLVQAALRNDPSRTALLVDESRAKLALDKILLAPGQASLTARTGELSLVQGSEGISFGAGPALEASTRQGWKLEASLPFSLGPEPGASPSLGLRIPLGPASPEGLAARAAAATGLGAAQEALARRAVEVEKELALALQTAYEARAAREAARRGVEKAKAGIETAMKVDGLEAGGAAYFALERSLRAEERKERDALRAEEDAAQVLARVTGLEAPGLPEELPQADLDIVLPLPETLAAPRAALAAEEGARLSAAEAAWSPGPGLEIGAALSAAPDAGSVTLKTGLSWSVEDFDLSAGASWRAGLGPGPGPSGEPTGPAVALGLSWKRGRAAESRIAAEDGRLGLRAAAARTAAALEDARRALRDLGSRRTSLLARRADIAEDLEFAQRERVVYDAWRGKGAVGDAEYEEVLAFEREARSRLRAAELDAILWNLELRLLMPAEGSRK